MTRDAWVWAGLDALWERFLPETPFGRSAKARLVPYTDRAALEECYGQTDAALALLSALDADRVTLDRIRYHLNVSPVSPRRLGRPTTRSKSSSCSEFSVQPVAPLLLPLNGSL